MSLGGIGHVGTGAEVKIAFNDGDFTWEDVNLEAAKLFESSDDEDATVVGAKKPLLLNHPPLVMLWLRSASCSSHKIF